jgi:hypothetical protein
MEGHRLRPGGGRQGLGGTHGTLGDSPAATPCSTPGSTAAALALLLMKDLRAAGGATGAGQCVLCVRLAVCCAAMLQLVQLGVCRRYA